MYEDINCMKEYMHESGDFCIQCRGTVKEILWNGLLRELNYCWAGRRWSG